MARTPTGLGGGKASDRISGLITYSGMSGGPAGVRGTDSHVPGYPTSLASAGAIPQTHMRARLLSRTHERTRHTFSRKCTSGAGPVHANSQSIHGRLLSFAQP